MVSIDNLAEYTGSYESIGQQLQHVLASSAFFWLLTLAIVFFIVAVLIGGFKKVATSNGFKWLFLHTLSIFLIGYFLMPKNLNKFVNVALFALFVTAISAGYRYVLYQQKWKKDATILWFFINLFTLLIIQIIYEVLHVTDILLQLLFAAFCLTLVGASVHGAHKNTSKPAKAKPGKPTGRKPNRGKPTGRKPNRGKPTGRKPTGRKPNRRR